MQKIANSLALAVLLTGCVVASKPGAQAGDGSVSSAIKQYEQERPGLIKVCLALDDGFSYAKGKFVNQNRAHNFEDVQARWDHLVRLGLFTKTTDKNSVVYSITKLGTSSYNDGKCTNQVQRYNGDYSGPALTYGRLEFDRIIKTERNPYQPVFTASFRKKFTTVEQWATDKELRRAWKLQGLDEVERFNWFVSYKQTSNGIDFVDPPQLYVLQN